MVAAFESLARDSFFFSNKNAISQYLQSSKSKTLGMTSFVVTFYSRGRTVDFSQKTPPKGPRRWAVLEATRRMLENPRVPHP
jgi:hypothetical protein